MTQIAAQHEISIPASMLRIYATLSAARRRELFLVLLLMLLGAIGELATIGAVLPFLTLLADPSGLDRFGAIARLLDRFGSADQRLVGVTALFIGIAIASALLRLQLAWSSQNFVNRVGHELAVEIQRRILLQPYSFHIARNTSTLVSSIEKVQLMVFNVLQPLMQAASGLVLSLFIVAALVAVDPFTAITAALAFLLIYLLISALTQRRLTRNSGAIGAAYDGRLKIVQESLGGIRDILIDGSQPVFLAAFRRLDERHSRARANIAFIGAAPRFVIEGVGMVLIALLANIIAQREGGIAGALPILGALALGAQRLLPLVQQIYSGWTTARGHRSITGQVLELLDLPEAEDTRAQDAVVPLPLNRGIVFDRVSFAYGGRRVAAVRDVTLTIPRGSTVGLIGKTGSGKSTLADLLMGLLEPTAGVLSVDDVAISAETRRRWWRSIAHVPQAVFLADDSIARNIAFGVPSEEIDMARVTAAAHKAQLTEVVDALPDGYGTLVGERGIRLSGGQRQRLGLARAIYKGAPVLVLDEATSALDDATEAAVMDAIAALGREGQTIIIIAHRLTTVARCDLVARLDNGRLVEAGSFADLVGGPARVNP